MRNLSKRLSAIVVLTLFLSVIALTIPRGTASAANSSDSQFFPQTGHTVSGQFLAYWQQHGGLAIFGYPLTDAEQEIDQTTGKTYLTQWFERNVFQLHPEFAGTPYEVELGLLGNQVTAQRRANEEGAFNSVADAHYPGGIYFPQTGHNLRNDFLKYWNNNGGLAIFGYPISEEFNEVNPDDGKTYVVQYFERNRFEYHPDLKNTPYVVELGLLGKQLLNTRVPVQSNDASVFASQASVNGLAIDAQGDVYLSDGQYNRVQKFSSNGTRLAVWGSSGSANGQFNNPKGVALDNQGNVYVADSYNNRIQKFNANGTFLASFGQKGSGNGQFDAPLGVAVGSDGSIFVADSNNHRVQKFDANGNYLLQWGSLGTNAGQFGPAIHGLNSMGPHYIAIDSQNRVYVTDDGNSRTEEFDSSGNFIRQLATQYPMGLAISNQNQVYVLLTNGLVEFSADGQQLNKIEGGNSANSPLNGGKALAIEKKSSTLYIANAALNQVYKLPQG